MSSRLRELPLLRRPELLLVGLLIVVVALLPKGLPLGIAGAGAVTGSVLALHALGIVLLYTRTHILSFAQFGLGAASAVLFFLWVQYNQWAVLAHGVCGGCLGPEGSSIGDLQRNPDAFRAYLDEHSFWVLVVNAAISALLAVLLAADTGGRVHTLISRSFARAPRIIPTIATLALAFALGTGAVGIIATRTLSLFGWRPFTWFPYGPRPGTGRDGTPAVAEGRFEAPLDLAWEFQISGGARFHLYDVLSVVAALLALGVVTAMFRVGRRGLLSRAAADNPERAQTLGLNVDVQARRLWRVAGALSGVAGVLGVSLSANLPAALDLSALTLVLAAVVLARLSSPGIAVLGSVLLGVLDQGMFWNFGSHVQFQGSLVLLIAAALILQRRRGSRAERDSGSVFTTAPEPVRVPEALRNARGVHGFLRLCAVTAGALFVGYPLVTSPGQLSLGIVLISYMVIGLSLLVLSGWAGQVSLGQFAFAAVGGYVTALSAASASLPAPIAMLLGAAIGAVVAALIGLPALRLPGPFVVIMTLAFSLAVPAVLLNRDLLGSALPDNLGRPVLLGIDLESDRSFYYFSLLVLLAALGIVAGLRRSRLRRVLIAGRDNEQAARAFGVDVLRLRIEGFAVAGFLAALGGGLLAYASGGVEPDSFSAENSVLIFLIVIIGGLGAVSGPVLGGVIYGLVQLLGTAWLVILNGLGTLLVLLFRPGGLASVLFTLRDAAVRVILHLQGTDLTRVRLSDGVERIAIADRGARADVVPVRYRLTGTGYGPVEGTRLRPVDGATSLAAADLELAGPEDLQTVGLLACHRLEVAYGGVSAVSGVSFDLAPGEVLAIVGTNGAGKSSLLRALAGLEPLEHGSVAMEGVDITADPAYARARAGLAFVPGGAGVLPTLSVADNLTLANWDNDGHHAMDVDGVLDAFPVLAARLDTQAGNLSGGEQQVLAVAQALLRRPRVLLVDELSLGLSPEALAQILTRIRELADSGTAVVLVEQSISTAMSFADTALFLDNGRVRYQGPAGELREHPELFASIAFGTSGGSIGSGSEMTRLRTLTQRVEREPALSAVGLTAGYGGVVAVRDVSLHLAPGEVVGVLGPNGAGKTSLFDCLSGTLPLTSGSLSLLGNDITREPTHRRAALGLMRSYQNVRLFPSLTVRECIAVALETRLSVRSSVYAGLWLPPARAEERRVDERVDVLLELLKLEPVSDTAVGALSLGSRRQVDLACQLAARPKVLLLDEPTSGMAQAETDSLGPLIGRISKDLDCAVLIVEHNISVLSSIADRLVAMSFGEIIADGTPDDVLSNPDVRGAYFGATATTPARPLVPSA